jgi:hypothetical protein
MANTVKAVELLGLPQEFSQYDGQIKTRTQRQAWIYEVTDTTTYPSKTYYTWGIDADKTDSFGMYPLNYAAGAIAHMGFSYQGIVNGVATLDRPGKFVTSTMGMYAGIPVYYVWAQIKMSQQGIDYLFEPYETTWNGVVDDMKDPMIRIGYKARIVSKGADGKPYVSWTSKYAINPKKRFRKAEFLQLIGISMEEFMYKTRTSWNRVATNPDTHINNIAMDIEQLPGSKLNAIVYINGVDAKTFNYKTLINSFDQTYTGYMQNYRLYNGPGTTVDNVYGSTLNIGVDPTKDATITTTTGVVNAYNATTKTLTYDPNLVYNASIVAYMEFMPAGGKNENCGKEYFLETGIEKLF